VVSARGCVDEPHLYGPLRLIDAASRLIGIMRREGRSSEVLDRVQRMIEEGKHLVMYDEEAFVRLLDQLVAELVRVVKGADRV
jgi:hypothetical protein